MRAVARMVPGAFSEGTTAIPNPLRRVSIPTGLEASTQHLDREHSLLLSASTPNV